MKKLLEILVLIIFISGYTWGQNYVNIGDFNIKYGMHKSDIMNQNTSSEYAIPIKDSPSGLMIVRKLNNNNYESLGSVWFNNNNVVYRITKEWLVGENKNDVDKILNTLWHLLGKYSNENNKIDISVKSQKEKEFSMDRIIFKINDTHEVELVFGENMSKSIIETIILSPTDN